MDNEVNNNINNSIPNDFIDDEDNVAVIINPNEDNGILIDNSVTNNNAKSIDNNTSIINENNTENTENESDQDNYSDNIDVDDEIIENHSNDILSSLDKEYATSVGKNVSEVANVAKKVTAQNLVNIDEDNGLENSDEDNWLVGSNNVISVSSNRDEKVTEEEKQKEISKLKSIVNETDDVDPEEGKPNVAKSTLLAMLKPGGQLNKRFVAVVGFGILLVVAVMISRSDNTTTKDAKALPIPDEARTVGKENIETAELSPVRTRYSPKEEETNNPNPNPEPVLTVPPPPVTIPPAPAPLPTPKIEVEESKEFAIELRAGTEAALKTINPTKTEEVKGEEISLQGLSVPMMLLEPFRSGISTLVKAQVVADIRDGKGTIIIPNGSRVQVPFERFEVDGRVINDAQQATLILLPNGNKLSAKGLVKGIDGFAGIRGKVKKLSKGNVFARMGKTVTRVGARVVGVTTGGFAGRGIEDSINESIDQNIEFIPNGRIVEVLPGTRFTFNVN